MLNGQAFFDFKKWAVAGDVANPNKWAHTILMRLMEAGYTVYGVDPRHEAGPNAGKDNYLENSRPLPFSSSRWRRQLAAMGDYPVITASLKDLPEKVDVLDLVINPAIGLKIVMDAGALGIDKILIQPGASSPEILEYCSANGIHVVQSCVLVELEKRNRRT